MSVSSPDAIPSLVQAVRATSLFDGLSGQLFNLHKSGWWTTHESPALQLQAALPSAPRLRSLGVCINLDLRGTKDARAPAVARFRAALRAIRVLPLSPFAKATFVARKAMPRPEFRPPWATVLLSHRGCGCPVGWSAWLAFP